MSNQITTPGKIIEQRPQLKEFSLSDILSLASGAMLPQSGVNSLHALVAYITEKDPGADTTATGGRDAKECLLEQFAFLKTVDYTFLHAAFRKDKEHIDDHLKIWLETQVRKYGATHHVMPLSRWNRRKNSHVL